LTLLVSSAPLGLRPALKALKFVDTVNHKL
jgi:hypothetical protein